MTTSGKNAAMRVLVTGGSGFIGTSLVRQLVGRGAEVCNVDLKPPHFEDQQRLWVKCDVMDLAALTQVVARFQPTHVIHLAAETSIEPAGRTIEEDYPINCGAISVLARALSGQAIQRAVLVSTQYVCGPGRLPLGDEDWFPHSDYGRSKVVMEKASRTFPHPWVIIRPTYIWGPWHLKYFYDVCRVLANGRYLHPSGEPVIRSYGYVDSTAWAMIEAATNPQVEGRVLYATDEPENSFHFVDRLSRALRGGGARRAPRILLRSMAVIGDRWRKFPLNSFRYHAMTTSYPVPWEASHRLLGTPPVDKDEGARLTADWYHSHSRNR